MSAIKHIYVIREIPMKSDDRAELYGAFTDLRMAIAAFNTLSSSVTGSHLYYSNRNDIIRIEPKSGDGSCWLLEQVPLTCRPDTHVVECQALPPGYGNMSAAALDAWDRARNGEQP